LSICLILLQCACRARDYPFFSLIDPRPSISTLFPYTTLFRSQGKREQFSGFNRTLDAINNVFRKFSAFHDETGRLNVDGINIIRDRKSGSAGMPRPISYAVFCLKKKKREKTIYELTNILSRVI